VFTSVHKSFNLRSMHDDPSTLTHTTPSTALHPTSPYVPCPTHTPHPLPQYLTHTATGAFNYLSGANSLSHDGHTLMSVKSPWGVKYAGGTNFDFPASTGKTLFFFFFAVLTLSYLVNFRDTRRLMLLGIPYEFPI
jgi:hypothetical protein